MDEAAAAAIAGRVEGAAAELGGLGVAVVWLRSLALLDEEKCFCLFSAETVEDVSAPGSTSTTSPVVTIGPRT